MIVGVVAVKQESQLVSLDDMAVDPAVFLLWVGGVMLVMGFLGCMGPLREHLILLKLVSTSLIDCYSVACLLVELKFKLRIEVKDSRDL